VDLTDKLHSLDTWEPTIRLLSKINRHNREPWKHGNQRNRDFCQMPWFCQNAVFL